MKVYIESYGCTFNKADGQIMAGILNENNIELVDNINDCDVIIVNTCYVKLPTENKIVYKIQQLQKNYPDKKIIVRNIFLWFIFRQVDLISLYKPRNHAFGKRTVQKTSAEHGYSRLHKNPKAQSAAPVIVQMPQKLVLLCILFRHRTVSVNITHTVSFPFNRSSDQMEHFCQSQSDGCHHDDDCRILRLFDPYITDEKSADDNDQDMKDKNIIYNKFE